MFSGITNLTDLNRKRAELCQSLSRTEWPQLNLEYTKAANEIRSAAKKTGRVNIPIITPSVLFSSQPAGGITEALYDPNTKCLVLYKMQDTMVKSITTGAERTVKINMRQGYIEVGVQL